ncbi:THO complex subunit 1 transcription elongation factor domain-containing protein [Ditylenchus destructor]|uniref:THO complex subunit 1 transcription elongation factor domain-containing protein n=1 Tax=Ditylenchus destructor TaxID=166010 RepID=A0AAD4R3L7_9BILA|nr:THO complex subunit 1 transcription elongation factor domain-containing protein [Ditylenchus destructor]
MDKAVESLNVEGVKLVNAKLKEAGQDTDQIRSNIERTLRSRALSFGNSRSVEDVDQFLQFVIRLAQEEQCPKSLCIQILQDIFDVSPIKRCEQLFGIVENNIAIFKTDFFFSSCKNMILRMCNDLLKRISRTVDTGFCGRILILLARSLPLNEKSGLNLPGHFNTENTTSYEQDKPDEDADMEVGEIRENKDSAINVDYGLYAKFWEIQNYFCNPTVIIDSSTFERFKNEVSDVLDTFSTYKLERPSSAVKVQQNERSISSVPAIYVHQNGIPNGDIKIKKEIKTEDEPIRNMDQKPSCSTTSAKEDDFFAKYLTNQKLFHLQLADSQFRRYFLVQCLILANYITSRPKSKETSTNLTGSQENFLKEVTDQCFALLKETYPQGTHFVDSVKRILARERIWSNWKSEGCIDLITPLTKLECKAFKKRPVKRYQENVIDLGNDELTRLWNINSENLNACIEAKRNAVPDLRKFLDDGLDELDPAQKVEEQYKSVNDEKYQWMASRFLLYNSDQYMMCPNSDPKAPRESIGKYLEKAILQSAMFHTPELKIKAENIKAAIVKKLADEEAEKIKLANEEQEKIKREAEAAQEEKRRQDEEEQKKKHAEEEKKRKAAEEDDKKRKAEAEEEQKRKRIENSRKSHDEESKPKKAHEEVQKIVVQKKSNDEQKPKKVQEDDQKLRTAEEEQKHKERNVENDKHDPAPASKSSSKSKRISNAGSTNESDARDGSPVVPPKKPREESSNHKRVRQPSTPQTVQESASSHSSSRRSNGESGSSKYSSSRKK